MRVGPGGCQFIPFDFGTASMPASKRSRPCANAQADQDQTKAEGLEAHLLRFLGHSRPNKRNCQRRHRQPDLKTITEYRTPKASEGPFDTIIRTWLGIRHEFEV